MNNITYDSQKNKAYILLHILLQEEVENGCEFAERYKIIKIYAFD